MPNPSSVGKRVPYSPGHVRITLESMLPWTRCLRTNHVNARVGEPRAEIGYRLSTRITGLVGLDAGSRPGMTIGMRSLLADSSVIRYPIRHPLGNGSPSALALVNTNRGSFSCLHRSHLLLRWYIRFSASSASLAVTRPYGPLPRGRPIEDRYQGQAQLPALC